MAATLTADQEQTVFYSFPITKQEETEEVNPVDGTPDLVIWGKATDGTIDGDQEIVDPAWSAKAIQEWFDTKANIRMAHDPKRPVGKGVDIALTDDGSWVKSKICDPLAKHFIRNGVLNDYSVGISNPAFKYRDQKLDPTGKARRIITGHEDGSSRISEVTICDRGSNFNSKFQLAKAAADGSCEFVGKMLGDEAELAKAAPAELVKAAGISADDDMVNVDVPKSATITFSPADVAKLNAHRKQAAEREEHALEAVKAAEADIYKRDIDTATRRRLHAQGRALANLSYPIETHEDAENAVTLALSGHGDVSAAKALIRRVARKEKWQDILDRLDGKEGGTDDASKGAAVSGEPEAQDTWTAEQVQAAPDVAKADPGDEDGEGAMHHDDGEDDDTDSEADAMDKTAEVKAMDPDMAKKPKMPCPKCKGMNKPKAKFCGKCGASMMASAAKAAEPTPGEGVTGSAAADVEPVPAHREPDGPAFEAFEHDAGLPTVPDPVACEMKAAARHRSLGVPFDAGWLHDTLCPAYDPADVAKHYPHQDFSAIDEHAWQAKALDIAATAPLEQAARAMDLWQHARALKSLTPDLAGDLMQEAHKAFRDANPGPGSAPTPGEMSAERYRRPYISEGHAAPSPGQDPPNTAPIHPGHLAASQFGRGPLTEGQAADSPGNANPRPMPVPAPEVPGVPSRVDYSSTQRANARQAMSSMHDHIAMTFPDLCPMAGPGHMGEPPSHARPVPVGVGGPVPHGASKADGPEDESGEYVVPKSAPDAAAQVARLQKKLRKALKAAGMEPEVTKAALSVAAEPVTLEAANWGTDPEVIKSAVAEATSSLAAELAATRTEIGELRKVADAIANEPDPRVEAYRGPVFNKSSAPAAPQQNSAAGYEDRVKTAVLSTMYDQWRNSTNSELREEAWKFLLKEAGIDLTKST